MTDTIRYFSPQARNAGPFRDEMSRDEGQNAGNEAIIPVVVGAPVSQNQPPTIELPDRLDERFVLTRSPDSEAAHAYRLLRHRLASRGDPQVVAVSSPGKGEGKTECALNLALAIAEEGPRTLLLEAATVRPALKTVLGLAEDEAPNSYNGWSAVRVDGTGVDAAFASEPRQRLDRGEFLQMLERLRRYYDYVVIDAPSVAESADTNLVADGSDGVILAARAKSTRRKALRRAIERLQPAPLLGITLTNAPKSEVSC